MSSSEESTESVWLIEMCKDQLNLEGRVAPEIGMGLCFELFSSGHF